MGKGGEKELEDRGRSFEGRGERKGPWRKTCCAVRQNLAIIVSVNLDCFCLTTELFMRRYFS